MSVLARRRATAYARAEMRPLSRAARRPLVALAMGLVAGGVGAALQIGESASVYAGMGLGGPLYAVDAAVHDLALRARRPESYLQVTREADQVRVELDPRALITIVALDEHTIGELGAYNGGYPRSLHAQVVDRLLTAPPRVIAFDLGFFEPTPDDAALLAAFDRARSLPVPTRIVLAAAGLVPREDPLDRLPDGSLWFKRGLEPVPHLAERAEIGLSNVLPDDRGTIRGMPLAARLGANDRPTLGLAVVAGYLRRPTAVDARPGTSTVELAGRVIPVDQTLSVRINYFGPPSATNAPNATFRVVSFVDVLRGRVDPATWRGGIVLVGATGAVGLADDYWTPVSSQGRKMAGVEIHANVAATLFSTQFLRDAPVPAQVGLVIGLALTMALLGAHLPILLATAVAVCLLAAEIAASTVALYTFGVQVPVANPLLASAVAFVAVISYRVLIEQRRARSLVAALASVIPPSVASEIAREPERVRLGGERRTISVLFTDLKGFTSFSETVEPEVLGRVVTEYLDAMTAVVFQHGGTVDKFVGDAVMAFWNAPLDDPEHARHACEAALEMQSALERLGDGWESAGLIRHRMRIGINTGPASVGNMGSARRFAYTALGDTVNLGARLEPLNNEYGTWICVSQATLDAAGGSDRFLARFLDLVTVKGKTAPVAVYELIGRCGDTALEAEHAEVLSLYHQAMRLYRARSFEAAGHLFRQAATVRPDGPSSVYATRCDVLAVAPPEGNWDGVYVMKTKG
jgi:adenylate cyclase